MTILMRSQRSVHCLPKSPENRLETKISDYRGDGAVVKCLVLKQDSVLHKHSNSTQDEGGEQVQVYVGAGAQEPPVKATSDPVLCSLLKQELKILGGDAIVIAYSIYCMCKCENSKNEYNKQNDQN